jgi:hypothetical protein
MSTLLAIMAIKDLNMTRTFVFLTGFLLLMPSVNAAPATPPMLAPEPAMLLARIDDSDLRDEESLKQLMQIEYDKDALSMGVAVGSSFVPGAGWGLLYAKKPLQAAVPFTLTGLGFALSMGYLVGLFDTESTAICTHVNAGRVNDAECGYSEIPRDANQPDLVDNQDRDPRSPDGLPYFRTSGDYSRAVVGKDFDGQATGLIILGATYVVSTALGAVWAGSTVRSHNEQLRKDIESTAGNRKRGHQERDRGIRATPLLGVSKDRGLIGVTIDF